MHPDQTNIDTAPTRAQRAANLRTAWVLAIVALVFFATIVVAQCVDSTLIELAALGVAVIGFPLAALAARARA